MRSNAPTIGDVSAGNAAALVSFTPPASTGGAPIAGYTVTSSPEAKTATGMASQIKGSGLANGIAYTRHYQQHVRTLESGDGKYKKRNSTTRDNDPATVADAVSADLTIHPGPHVAGSCASPRTPIAGADLRQ